jgi:ABC-type Fe3+ transport system permease subunit
MHMIKTLFIRNILSLALVLAIMMAGFVAVPLSVSACGNGSGSSQDQVLNGVGESGGTCNSAGVTNTVAQAVNILSLIVGIAAIIVIIVSGLRYITSGGDSAKVGAAKNTLIYALIGVAIAALAQFLVHFVLNRASSAI